MSRKLDRHRRAAPANGPGESQTPIVMLAIESGGVSLLRGVFHREADDWNKRQIRKTVGPRQQHAVRRPSSIR